ncbi:MAG: hypothetical protein ACYC2R_06020 [Burkholderiales bacterium]
MDSIYYQTQSLPDARLADLSNDPNARNQFDNMMRSYGQQGWRAYHIAETDTGLLVFMLRVDHG